MPFSPATGTPARDDTYDVGPTNGPTMGPPMGRVTFLKMKSKAILNRLESIATDLDPDNLHSKDEYALNAILELLVELKSSFSVTHTSLEELDFESITSDLPAKFDTTLVNLRATLQREIGKRSTSQHCSTFRMNTADTQSIIVNANRSRVPLLTLPKFSGAFTEWTNFYAMFTSVIDKDSELTQVDKLQHLRSCLSGAALDTVGSLEINDTNYKIALELLQKRFDNKRLIFQAHIRGIFELDKVDSSVHTLRALTDKAIAHMRALQSIGSKEQISDSILIQLIVQRLDKVTQAKWEENSTSNDLPSWNQLPGFLEKRCRTLENVEYALQTQASIPVKVIKSVSTNPRKSFVASNSSVGSCVFCESPEHVIYRCQRYVNLSPNLRQKEAKRLNLCLNCLKKGHQIRDCKSGPCRSCQAKHHTLLHFDRLSIPPTTQCQAPCTISESNARTASLSVTSHTHTPSPDVVLLASAIVLIKNRAGTFIPCRALLDSGSQLHFVTTRFANQLQLTRTKSLVAVSGIGDASFSTDGCSVNIVLKSRTSDFCTNITAVVVKTITDSQPVASVNIANWNIPSNIQLADPGFNVPQRIDLLIGAGLFYELLCVGQIQLAPELPLLQKTRLGWVLSGGTQQAPKLSTFVASHSSTTDINIDDRLDDLVRQFWEIDHVVEPISKNSKEELDCELHFKQNFIRLASGAYSVRLPTKLNLDSLGESYSQARRRFQNLERKLVRNPELKAKYCAFMKEYRDLNHMSLVPNSAIHECKYFLPHHCVIKDESTTTKLRVVFDGSAATTSGLSLNDLLMTGPTIQPKLFNILIRFRTFPIALTGDICKMYRCVRIYPPDSMLQCILWRDSPEDDLNIYKLDTVTYGTKSAAFLAIRSMHQLASDESSVYPLGSQTIIRDFYVDDLISGGDTLEEVEEIKRQTTNILARGNFQLRKWCSNSPDVLRNISDADKQDLLKFNDGSDITKALGLIWKPFDGNLLFSFTSQPECCKNSKRSALSTLARCYDPLGLIGPTLTRGKILLQRMWRDKLEWDESLPHSLNTAWSTFRNEFVEVQHLSFPRYVLQPGATVEIHAFCDASIEAYGACIYIRSIMDDRAQVHLLCSKARVAPLKILTIPKLELCAAALLAELVNGIFKMKLFAGRFHCWSDSSIVLSWLREEPSKFNVFVANRVSAIQQLTEGMQWHYIPTELNPADILSKGASPTTLSQSPLWMHGPSFLREVDNNWPQFCAPKTKIIELRQKVLLLSNDRTDLTLSFKYINSFGKMQRIFGYVNKFITSRISPRTSQLTFEDIHRGTQLLIRIVQRAQLWSEYVALKNNKFVHASSPIASLSPFLDDFGLIRVGGRLRHSTLSFEARHPCILPRDHPLTFAIITHYHRALKRFAATRGIPSCIWSDNATNFVGARNELNDLRNLVLNENHRSAVNNYCISNGFDWRFIPPRSPHFGGLWEAAVKTAKQHLYRSVGSSILGFDELRTLVCQITAIINSRPLVPLSENPEDLDVLTPGHFLIGGPPTAFPEPNLTSLNYNRLNQWQRVSYIQQIFWKRWSQEYLTILQQRVKWRTPQPSIQVNDIVCIKEENTAPLKWPLARVVELITGTDDVARVAVLRTPTGITRRAINKLCVLPVNASVESPDLSTGGRMFGAAANSATQPTN
ncbi:uncharacterized protein LOC129250502 [Anastrepha obliqua]|uniref:uncharacterized protein LOC129250502 n=1 Tax=Anastrepha obliqua TaxID=95512 RepID=UPI002409757D|nr:uncharacterized protein LOC129250502 [Anastrepha obliqua]